MSGFILHVIQSISRYDSIVTCTNVCVPLVFIVELAIWFVIKKYWLLITFHFEVFRILFMKFRSKAVEIGCDSCRTGDLYILKGRSDSIIMHLILSHRHHELTKSFRVIVFLYDCQIIGIMGHKGAKNRRFFFTFNCKPPVR